MCDPYAVSSSTSDTNRRMDNQPTGQKNEKRRNEKWTAREEEEGKKKKKKRALSEMVPAAS